MRLSSGWHRKEANSGKGLIVTNQARIGHSQVAVKLWEGGDSVLERVDGTELQRPGRRQWGMDAELDCVQEACLRAGATEGAASPASGNVLFERRGEIQLQPRRLDILSVLHFPPLGRGSGNPSKPS